MWKIKNAERSAEEWATIVECVCVYMNHQSYPDEKMICAMLGLEKTEPDTDDET